VTAARLDTHLSPAEWLHSWTAGNRGLCMKCNADKPTADPLACPTCGPLDAEYARGGYRVGLSLHMTPLVPRATPAADALSRVSTDGSTIVSLTRLPKKQTPVVTVRHNGAVLLTDECLITRAASRVKLAEQCGAELLTFVQTALVDLAGAWTVHLAATSTGGEETKARLTRDIDPWPVPVDARDVLDALRLAIARHVALPEHGDIVLALWIAHTHWIEVLPFSPYLWLTSPTKQCGKTTVLELCELLTRRPWRLSNPTGAAMFRVIGEERPTLLLDEIDTVTGPRLEDLTGILNDGWHAAGKVARCVGDNHDVKTFSVFSAKALAGIGTTLQDATRSRCIRLPMARVTGNALATLTGLRTDRAERWAGPLRAQLARLAVDFADSLRECMQGEEGMPLPAGIDGRDAQAWEPLLAIADLAGAQWGAAARAACVALVGARRADDDGDAKVRLLRDVRDYFTEKAVDTASSTDLVAWLVLDESRGWAEYRGKMLSRETLARLLKPFGAAPVRITSTQRAWRRTLLQPLWEKYLEPPNRPDNPDTPDTVSRMSGVSGRSEGTCVVQSAPDDGYWSSLLSDEAILEGAEESFE
jgi:hypothetical protein